MLGDERFLGGVPSCIGLVSNRAGYAASAASSWCKRTWRQVDEDLQPDSPIPSTGRLLSQQSSRTAYNLFNPCVSPMFRSIDIPPGKCHEGQETESRSA